MPDVAPLEEVPLLSTLREAELEQRVIVTVQYRYIRHPADDTGPSKAGKRGRSAAPLSIAAPDPKPPLILRDARVYLLAPGVDAA